MNQILFIVWLLCLFIVLVTISFIIITEFLRKKSIILKQENTDVEIIHYKLYCVLLFNAIAVQAAKSDTCMLAHINGKPTTGMRVNIGSVTFNTD